jgi:drug/metabolite transporter (DMT)-like permease
MFIGVIVMLIASALYNSAPIFLRTATRALPDRSGLTLLRAVLTRRVGLIGLALEVLGWGLEVVALTRLPLTLSRSLLAAGLLVLLVLAWRDLHEAIGSQEILGVLTIVGGIAAVSFATPARSTASPTLLQWAMLTVVLGAVVLAPYALRVGRHVTGTWLLAVSAGMAYALSALFTKQVANLVGTAQVPPLLVVLMGAAVCAVLGFMGELGALDRAQAADVAPVYRALQIIIPIAVAPLLFGEHWPSAIGAQSLLAGGLLLTVAGILLVSRRHKSVARAYAQAAR